MSVRVWLMLSIALALGVARSASAQTTISAQPGYELRYERAMALANEGRHLEAAAAFADVRDSTDGDRYLAVAGRAVVDQWQAQIEALVVRGELDACDAVRASVNPAHLIDARGQALLTPARVAVCQGAPFGVTTSPTDVRVMPIPEAVRHLMDARVEYSSRVPAALDRQAATDGRWGGPLRARFALLNARTLLRFGHIAQAELFYGEILSVYCDEANVTEQCFADLTPLLTRLGRHAELDVYAARRATSCRGHVGPEGPSNPFLHAVSLFAEAERAPRAQADELYARAAAEMDERLRAHPHHAQAALANHYVALALERSGRLIAAAERYLRVVNDYDGLRDHLGHDLTGLDLSQRINLLEASSWRAALTLERVGDLDRARERWRSLLADPRFVDAFDRAAHVDDARAHLAMIDSQRSANAPVPHERWFGQVEARLNALLRRPMRPTDVHFMEAIDLLDGLTGAAPARGGPERAVHALLFVAAGYERLAVAITGTPGTAEMLLPMRRRALDVYAQAIRLTRDNGLPLSAVATAIDRLRAAENAPARELFRPGALDDVLSVEAVGASLLATSFRSQSPAPLDSAEASR